MSLTEKDVRKIAKLARIGVTDEEVLIYKDQLSNILDMISVLQEVDTKNVQPLYNVAATDAYLREDKAIIENTVEEILENAPKKEYNCFLVPKVIE